MKEEMSLYSPQIISEENTHTELTSDDMLLQKTNIKDNFAYNSKKYSPNSIFTQNDFKTETRQNQNLNQDLSILNNIEEKYHSSVLNDLETNQNLNINQIDISQVFNSPSEVIIDNTNTKPMLNIHVSLLNLFQPSNDFYSQNSDIQFSSFFGTDIYRNGIPDKKIGISHISQAIAYAINNTQRIGIELGYTEYSYEQTVNVLVPMGSIINEKYIITQFNNDNEDDLILYPIKFNKNQQVFWGAAFYEESLLSNEYLSLNGRIGGGITSDGPLGYTRLFAKINLMKNLSLNIGSEGRLFLGRVPELNSEKSWKSSVSLIYGFQFKF
jgi:hypothetical protein